MTSEYCNLLIVLVLVGYLFYTSFTSRDKRYQRSIWQKIKHEMLEDSEQYFAESANLLQSIQQEQKQNHHRILAHTFYKSALC